MRNSDFRKLCGKKIGSGCDRVVYEHKNDPTLVIKYEASPTVFANAVEWNISDMNKRSDRIARCYDISNDSKFLIQERLEVNKTCEPVKNTRLRSRFYDLHDENYGYRKGSTKKVLLDYSRIKI